MLGFRKGENMKLHYWRCALVGGSLGHSGTIVMDPFQRLWASARPPKKRNSDNATVKTASALSRAVTGHALPSKRKNLAGNTVHDGFGTAMGAYGFAAERQPKASSAVGLPFRMALWAATDEAAVPALGLSESPTPTPARAHAIELASQRGYGVSTDLIRPGLNRWGIP